MKIEKRSFVEDGIWYVILYQVNLALDKDAIYHKPVQQIKEIYNGRIPAELYEKVFEGHISAKCFGSVNIFLFAHTPSFYKGRLLLPSSVIEIVKSPDESVFYMDDGADSIKVEFEKDKIKDNSEDEFISCVLSKDNVSLFYSSFHTMEQIKCSTLKVYMHMEKRGQSDYELHCTTVDGMNLQFRFCEFPSILLTNCMEDLPEEVLYVTDKQTGCRFLDKDNLELVSEWLTKQDYIFERF